MGLLYNMLSAFQCGLTTPEEDSIILKEIEDNAEFSEMMDILDEINSMDELTELKNEFNEQTDCLDKFQDISTNKLR